MTKIVKCSDCRFEDDYDNYYEVDRYCPQCGAKLTHSIK